MKERIAPVMGYVGEGDQSTKAAMVVIVATGDTFGLALLNLQARIESVSVLSAGTREAEGNTPVIFTPFINPGPVPSLGTE